MGATRQALHDLRGQLGTIRLSATLLERESDLTEIGLKALKRIAVAIESAEEQLLVLERLPAHGGTPAPFMLPEPGRSFDELADLRVASRGARRRRGFGSV